MEGWDGPLWVRREGKCGELNPYAFFFNGLEGTE